MKYLRCKCFRSFHIIYFSRFMSWSFIFKRNRIFWTPIKYTIFLKIVTSQASSEYVFQIIVVWCLREFQTSAVSEILNIDNLDSQWVANFYSKLKHIFEISMSYISTWYMFQTLQDDHSQALQVLYLPLLAQSVDIVSLHWSF